MNQQSNSHKMKRPTKKELLKQFNRLKALNVSGRYHSFNSFKKIAQETETPYKLSDIQLRNMLQDKSPKVWRPHHFTYWEACKAFVKKC